MIGITALSSQKLIFPSPPLGFLVSDDQIIYHWPALSIFEDAAAHIKSESPIKLEQF
jgi:hypothetical protein